MGESLAVVREHITQSKGMNDSNEHSLVEGLHAASGQ